MLASQTGWFHLGLKSNAMESIAQTGEKYEENQSWMHQSPSLDKSPILLSKDRTKNLLAVMI